MPTNKGTLATYMGYVAYGSWNEPYMRYNRGGRFCYPCGYPYGDWGIPGVNTLFFGRF